ncbi:MAG: hypothetical protein ACLFPV_12920 [Spirochaetaceae bacterium]
MHNLRKSFRINCLSTERHLTHAARAGVAERLRRPIVADSYRRRAFRTRTPLRCPVLPQWLRMDVTPLEGARPYLPGYLLA